MLQTFHVTGMTCGHCEKAVRAAIAKVDPDAQTRIERSADLVEVQSMQPRAALADAISQEGYAVAD